MSTATAKAPKTQKAQAPAAETKIVGQGTLSASGLPFLLVTSSSEPGRCHVVSYAYEGAFVGARMHCDCTAASFGRECRHTQIVRTWLAQGLEALGIPVEQRARETVMLTVVYQDRRGAGCVKYPHTEKSLLAALRNLRHRHLCAEVRKDGQRIGAVQADSAAPGGWTYWVDADAAFPVPERPQSQLNRTKAFSLLK